MRIADHPATLRDLAVGDRIVRLWTVPDLEQLVDRDALLRGEAEPPYWAYVWSGALVLARYLTRAGNLAGRRVLEIGCGLGLPGITSAILGATTTCVDAAAPALAFVAASAAANTVRCTPVVADFTRLDPTLQFDLVVAAEVAYDRTRYPELAAVFERHVAADGVALLADGYRTDTRGLYTALAALDFDVHAVDVRVHEEGRPMPVRLTMLRRPRESIRRRDTRRPPA